MNVKFDPNNVVIQLCLSGLNLEDSGKPEDAAALFQKAWHAHPQIKPNPAQP